MQQSSAAFGSLAFALLIAFYTGWCAEVETEGFDVKTEVISPTGVRISWHGVGDENGVPASRFRVFCSSPDGPPIEAISTEKFVEIKTFTSGLTYTCEVHPVWDNLVEGMQVLSASPAISEPFTVNFEGGVHYFILIVWFYV